MLGIGVGVRGALGQRALEQRAPRLVDGHAAQLAEQRARRLELADALEVLDRLE
jgi:hypothetical protein